MQTQNQFAPAFVALHDPLAQRITSAGRGLSLNPMKLKIERAVLVYQAGIANVFAVDCFNFAASGRTETRLLQSDFRTAEAFARGLAAAGTRVASAGCNMAGDIARCGWEENFGPFRDNCHPVWAGVNPELHISFEPATATLSR